MMLSLKLPPSRRRTDGLLCFGRRPLPRDGPACPRWVPTITRSSRGDSWRHEKITLEPVNPDFAPIVLAGADEESSR